MCGRSTLQGLDGEALTLEKNQGRLQHQPSPGWGGVELWSELQRIEWCDMGAARSWTLLAVY